MSLSLKHHVTADIYRLLVGVAMEPYVFFVLQFLNSITFHDSPDRSVAMVGRHRFQKHAQVIKVTTIAAVSVAVLSVAVVLGYRFMHKAS